MKRPPSPMQDETLEHIRVFLAEKGYAPTVAELAAKAGVRSFAMQNRLDALEDKGHIKRDAKVARSIRLL
ncbi:hypothetical protein N5J43_08235 [Pseudomonas nicosulfuronedens]|uniref:LexA family protein n=1 Tax=Pseudomonas nicosulfuronedens TaxID=2571105 RepID=UPI002447997A|nr:hypothetical protein [Pseudomonas nicosulfuronedens]MDH1009961.1 hypothetical protein [Pseudomonas nicosulfuronedens]MDH1978937.1 hypothetical protein [Pseudomonas nicosulfuronedens]MDH2028384.1 hypothetical protein [Pseudomonas nicosulfuronedens]